VEDLCAAAPEPHLADLDLVVQLKVKGFGFSIAIPFRFLVDFRLPGAGPLNRFHGGVSGSSGIQDQPHPARLNVVLGHVAVLLSVIIALALTRLVNGT
jgi:hypothetical protein